ncbi:hypothetical protein AX14_000998 [Amanita brunnescens Koide BX004]|nr:hypothetical protein AX14_000998 [Amanita brunnescens Koide BX004]
MVLPFPMQDVHYRIQSVDLATYLELYDVNDEKVVLRLMKDCLEQQWTFIASESGTGGNSYKIQNVATQSLRNPRYLSIAPNNPQAPNGIAVTDEDQPVVWSLKDARRSDSQKDIYSITCKGTQRGHEIFFLVQEDGKTGYEEAKLSNNNNFSQSKKWKILDLNRVLASYHCRPWQEGSTRSGMLSLGNGKCLIKSASESEVVYLGYEGSEGGLAKVAKKDSPHFWTVESLGEYTYSISTKFVFPDHASTVLELTSGNNNEATHNHIWIFEAVDVNTEDNPPPYESKCYPEIITGGYRLKNIGTGQYIYVTNHPRRLYPFSYGDRLYLSYLGPGGEFTLKYSECYLERSGDLLVCGLGNNSGSRWVLEQDKDPSGNFCYLFVDNLHRLNDSNHF